ncbi:hypothetical protein BJP36_24720 [Moorena producens JHB]|uniref:Uncharacterized protein n=1 Tax=Moorena producens (strain JHB) TaxID=1454205 RepID=A0A1D9G4X8_MOOP1|nr:hypothetical protein [Moorena producens]AOY82643.2 hypothetical protein BJP36_24720 [Moorena producens JHB]
MFPTNYLCLPLSRMGAGILSDCMVKPGGKLTEEWILCYQSSDCMIKPGGKLAEEWILCYQSYALHIQLNLPGAFGVQERVFRG